MNAKAPRRSFGQHIKSLRRARGMTQELLAEMSGLSADTIRRLEHGSFSPSLDTLSKLCGGLDLRLSTLFESFELGLMDDRKLLFDLISSRSAREIEFITHVVRAIIDVMNQAGGGEDG